MLKHSILHLNKTVGKLAAACENADHGEKQDTDLSELAIKLFVNSLKFAEEVGLRADDLVKNGRSLVK